MSSFLVFPGLVSRQASSEQEQKRKANKILQVKKIYIKDKGSVIIQSFLRFWLSATLAQKQFPRC